MDSGPFQRNSVKRGDAQNGRSCHLLPILQCVNPTGIKILYGLRQSRSHRSSPVPQMLKPGESGGWRLRPMRTGIANHLSQMQPAHFFRGILRLLRGAADGGLSQSQAQLRAAAGSRHV